MLVDYERQGEREKDGVFKSDVVNNMEFSCASVEDLKLSLHCRLCGFVYVN